MAAEAADRAIRSGHAVGPLHGVPVALKDLVDLEGRVTTGGSKVWEKRVSPLTATLARKFICGIGSWAASVRVWVLCYGDAAHARGACAAGGW